ncbi:MAG: hypothetical protein KDB14_23590, partial [Planctomycetales bacterium]|nr:hypothetical protein [Planctomycetales bacterium]
MKETQLAIATELSLRQNTGPIVGRGVFPRAAPVAGYLFAVIMTLVCQIQMGLAAEELRIDRPMSPPEWALLQQELLRTNVAACREYFDNYFDER